MSTEAQFYVGQVIQHRKFHYRGVIVDVDPEFQASEEWYQRVARSRPPKDHPWYHVLVDNEEYMTYVAERHLQKDDTGEPVCHPVIYEFFREFSDGKYKMHRKTN